MSLVERFTGTAAELHALAMPTSGGPGIWVMQPSGQAVVMGSSQRPEMFRADALAAHDIALATRRSGGGAVFLDPSAIVWVDVLAPRDSALWDGDLGQTFLAVGRCWQTALADCGVEAVLATAAPKATVASKAACWAGVGWGELTAPAGTVGASGAAKIVGLSQRRTRWGARIQGTAVLDDSARRVIDYLGVTSTEATAIGDAIGGTGASGTRLAATRGQFERAVIERLSHALAE